MANLNQYRAFAKAVADGEAVNTQSGKTLGKLRVAITVKAAKKNQQGQWEGGESLFMDLEAWDSDFRKLSVIIGSVRKGQQVYLEGYLRENQWTDQQGNKRSKVLVVADKLFVLADVRPDPQMEERRPQQQPQQQSRGRTSQPVYPSDGEQYPDDHGGASAVSPDDEIPF